MLLLETGPFLEVSNPQVLRSQVLSNMSRLNVSRDDESVAKTTCCLKNWKSSYSKHGVGSQE